MGHPLSETQQVWFDIMFLTEKVYWQKEFYGRIFTTPWSASSIEFEIGLTAEIKWRLYSVFYDMKPDNVENNINKNKTLYYHFQRREFAKEKNIIC